MILKIIKPLYKIFYNHLMLVLKKIFCKRKYILPYLIVHQLETKLSLIDYPDMHINDIF